jgi:hypothetical protein
MLMGDFHKLIYISLDFVIVHSKWKLFSFLFLFSLTSCFFFRLYALRRIRDGFIAGKSLTDSTKITEALQKAEENLEVIKRQVRKNVMF